MPFSKRKRGNKFQVINTQTGDVKGTHDTEADADKQLAALHANNADKDKGHMDIKTKTVEATIEDAGGPVNGPGEFTVRLTTPDLDRDGDELHGDEWQTPLPGRIQFNTDHDHKVGSTVGSAVPMLEGEDIICRGLYASTEHAQNTRTLVKEGHITNVSVAYREKRDDKSGKATRELINGSFVVVPANTQAKVLASKSADDDAITVRLSDGQVDQVVSQIKDSLDKDSYGKSYLPDGFTAEMELDTEKSMQTLTIKDAAGKAVVSHEFPAPSTAPSEKSAADLDADKESREKATALARAQALTFETKTYVTEGN